MIETRGQIVGRMVGPAAAGAALPLLDPEPLLAAHDPIAALDGGFLVVLCGRVHPACERAMTTLDRTIDGAEGEVARFLRGAVDLVHHEIWRVAATDESLATRLSSAAARLADPRLGPRETAEAAWSLFFPEGVSSADQDVRAVPVLMGAPSRARSGAPGAELGGRGPVRDARLHGSCGRAAARKVRTRPA